VLASVRNGGQDLQTELAGVPRGAFDEVDEAKQLGQPMRSTSTNETAATGTKAGAKLTEELTNQQVEAIVAKYPQWDNTKDFVGRKLDPNNPPPGYSYRLKNGKPELYRDSKDGPFPPLTVENGIIMLQTGKTNRLSVFSRYKKNYLDWIEQTQGKAARIAAKQRVENGNQLHHLVPDAVVRDNPLTKQLMKRSQTYTLDRGTNILDMPTVHDPKTGEIVHLGSHSKFNRYVDRLLNQQVDKLTRNRTVQLDQVDVGELDKAIRQVENTLRSQIKNRTLPREILDLLEGGGFKISEENQDARGTAA
jgi:A nuclease family of the HNH/ENDO VII superfamily with conserved AHH